MRLKSFSAFTFAFCVLFFATGSFGAQNKIDKSPSAFLPESRYKFEPVLEGTAILHDFILQNKGTAPLMINKVKTG